MAVLEFDMSQLSEVHRDRLHKLILERYDSEMAVAVWLLRILEEDFEGKPDLPCESWSEETLRESSRVAQFLRDTLAGLSKPIEADFCNWILIILEEVWEDRNRVAVAS